MAFKMEVIADSSGKWASNALVFATEQEAGEYGADLAYRWTAVRDVRSVEVDEPVNATYCADEGLRHLNREPTKVQLKKEGTSA